MAEHLLGGQDLHLEYPTKRVFSGVTVGLNAGDRIGIVGRNGDGKTTLMNLLLGKLPPDEGLVTRRSGIRVGILGQTDDLDSAASVAAMVVKDRPDHEWASDPKVREVIQGLLSDLPWEAPIGSLSGGQRRRVALAALLVQDWDVLGLDEPTNHLDVEGINWLASHLGRRWSPNVGALMVVTHDRWFLDAVTSTTWEVHDGIVEPFEGGYAAYILQRVERDRMAAATAERRRNLLRKELAWLRRGAPARTSKPKFRLDAAAELIADEPPVRDSVELSKIAATRIGKRVVDLLDVSAGYGKREVLHGVTWRIAPGERTGILGANGAGKSTLLALITGALEPTAGVVRMGKITKVSMLDQGFSQLELIGEDLVRVVLSRIKNNFIVGAKEVSPSQMLERLGFRPEYLSARVNDLSGGQKRRLQLLLVMLEEPNVLVLDEPTNDLDTDMLAALEDVLDSWAGTLLVVSHDRYLLERVTDQQYAVIDGGLRHLPGGIEEYLKLHRNQSENSSDADQSHAAQTTNSELRGAELHAAQKDLAAAERKLRKLEQGVHALHQQMAQHDQSDYQGLSALTDKLNRLSEEKDSLEEHWLELSDLLP